MKTYRNAVEKAIEDWNYDHGEARGLLYRSLRWERDAIPRLTEGDAQEIINQDIIRRADVVIALFGSRLGQGTGRSVSGTAEEIEEGSKQGARTHVFFSAAPISRDGFSAEQYGRLMDYKESLRPLGLLGEYRNGRDLQRQVGACLTSDASRFGSMLLWSGMSGVALQFELLEAAPTNVLIVRNYGSSAVEKFVVETLESKGRAVRALSSGREMRIEVEGTVRLEAAPGHAFTKPLLVGFSLRQENIFRRDRVLVS